MPHVAAVGEFDVCLLLLLDQSFLEDYFFFFCLNFLLTTPSWTDTIPIRPTTGVIRSSISSIRSTPSSRPSLCRPSLSSPYDPSPVCHLLLRDVPFASAERTRLVMPVVSAKSSVTPQSPPLARSALLASSSASSQRIPPVECRLKSRSRTSNAS